MINAQMKRYSYSTIGAPDGYGQPTQSPVPVGEIKIAICSTEQHIQDNVLYSGASYIGLTHAAVDDSFVIHYGDIDLKVLYVNPFGRYKQVFMAEM